MKMTVLEGEHVVSTEELKGLIFRLSTPDRSGSYINLFQNDTMGAEVYEKEIILGEGKSLLLQTRHAPSLQPVYDILDGYKGMILVDILCGETHVIIEW